jgi:hypothetical protein
LGIESRKTEAVDATLEGEMTDLVKQALTNAFIASITVVLSLGVAEILLRVSYLDNPWTTQNFAVEVVNQQRTNLAIQYDPIIGYIFRPGFSDVYSSSDDLGLRHNVMISEGSSAPPRRPGGILAVGDSFTFGSEVMNHESWPANLERLLGTQVYNAGAGGYGPDQAYLRAVSLLDTLQPRAIVFSFIPAGISRNEFSINTGLLKPYFAVVNGKLDLRNTPVPMDVNPELAQVGFVKATLGYSYAAYWTMDRLGRRATWHVQKWVTTREHQQGYEVTCKLMDLLGDIRLKRQIPIVILIQYSGLDISSNPRVPGDPVAVIASCAEKNDLQVVDLYEPLRKAFAENPEKFWSFYVKQPRDSRVHTGHMSASGNEFVSRLVAHKFQEVGPELINAN